MEKSLLKSQCVTLCCIISALVLVPFLTKTLMTLVTVPCDVQACSGVQGCGSSLIVHWFERSGDDGA